MPVTFSSQLNSSTALPNYFEVTLNNGQKVTPLCVQAAPANEDNEMQTFMTIAQEYGDGAQNKVWPTKFSVVGDVLFSDGSSAKGLEFEIGENENYVSNSPFLVQADLLVYNTDGESKAPRPANTYPN